jgi:hypothetical protein
VGIEQGILPGCGGVISSEGDKEVELTAEDVVVGKPRYELIDREQLCWRRVDVERLIGESIQHERSGSLWASWICAGTANRHER